MTRLPCVVSIAGTDPSGGAGIQADIKAISATGAYAASIITALVAQNTTGVFAIESISTTYLQQQIDSVFNDLSVDAVKIGMLHHEGIMRLIVENLSSYQPKSIVLDPVIVAKDGSLLLELEGINYLKHQLFPLVDLITPNLLEAEYLLKQGIQTKEEMKEAAIQLGTQYKVNVLMKGGHLSAEDSTDILFYCEDKACYEFRAERITTQNTHGTGCSLSAAIASYLAQGFNLFEAVSRAKTYITCAIQSGKTYSVGKGQGPVDHFYFLGNRHS